MPDSTDGRKGENIMAEYTCTLCGRRFGLDEARKYIISIVQTGGTVPTLALWSSVIIASARIRR